MHRLQLCNLQGCTASVRRARAPAWYARGTASADCVAPLTKPAWRQVSRCVEEVLQETLNVLNATEDEDTQQSRQVRPAHPAACRSAVECPLDSAFV